MRNKISEMINKNLNIQKSGLQGENQYKTVMKRNKEVVDHNRKTGMGMTY